MTRVPETRFVCDRCQMGEVIAVMNSPAHVQQTGPADWLSMVVGLEPGTPPSHLCPLCAQQFSLFMGNHKP